MFFPRGVGAQERKLVGYERIIYYVMRLGSITSVGILYGYYYFV